MIKLGGLEIDDSCAGGLVYLNLTVERVMLTNTGQTKMVIAKVLENHFLGTVIDCTTNMVCQDCNRRSPGCLSCPAAKFLATDGFCSATCSSNTIQQLSYVSLDDTSVTGTSKVTIC